MHTAYTIVYITVSSHILPILVPALKARQPAELRPNQLTTPDKDLGCRAYRGWGLRKIIRNSMSWAPCAYMSHKIPQTPVLVS